VMPPQMIKVPIAMIPPQKIRCVRVLSIGQEKG